MPFELTREAYHAAASELSRIRNMTGENTGRMELALRAMQTGNPREPKR